MATITKSKRNTSAGEIVRWQVRWVDPDGQRRSRKFETRAGANAKHAKVLHRLEMGLPGEGADVGSVLEGVQAWVDHIEGLWRAGKRERSTWKQYTEHLRLHIAPAPVAALELKKLTAVDCQAFAWWLEKNRSAAMAKCVFASFKAALSHCVASGLIAINPAVEVGVDTKTRALLTGEAAEAQERAVIPPLEDVRAVMEAAQALGAGEDGDKGRALAVMCLVTFAGLRASELRGLPLAMLLLFGNAPEVKIRQRADHWNVIGPPKSKRGYRTIPLGPFAVDALRRWAANITGSLERLAFATESGKPYSYGHLYRHVLLPVMIRARLVTLHPSPDKNGAPIVKDDGHFAGAYCPLTVKPRWSFHDYRHVAASLWIDMGIDPKRLQFQIGHADIGTTMNIYGHLFDRRDRSANQAAAAEVTVMTAPKRANAVATSGCHLGATQSIANVRKPKKT